MARKIFALVLVSVVLFSYPAHCGLFENKKISQALQDDTVRIGMTKDALVAAIGYPPDGGVKQGAMFYRFAQSKVTAAGKEESWTYQIGASAEGVRSVTFKIADGKVSEWNEWLDTKK
jgi:hypothetical protein